VQRFLGGVGTVVLFRSTETLLAYIREESVDDLRPVLNMSRRRQRRAVEEAEDVLCEVDRKVSWR
jgi:hypothetical protein